MGVLEFTTFLLQSDFNPQYGFNEKKLSQKYIFIVSFLFIYQSKMIVALSNKNVLHFLDIFFSLVVHLVNFTDFS